MAEHSVFSGAPPWEPTAHNDGDPTIVTAVAFYSAASPWMVVGGRFRVPVGGSAIFPAQVTVSLHIAPLFTLVDLSDPVVASATANVADGWCEARWAGVLLEVGQAAWISIQGIGSQDVYLFVAVGTVGVPALQADDASDLYLAEAGTSPPLEQPRAAFLSGGITTLSQAWYGIDILVEAPEALAAYAFDEGAGTTAADAIGSRDITVVSGNWEASGHTGSAFTGAGGVRNVPSHAGLETAERTLTFWARTPGTVGNQWGTQFYIIASDTAAWGIGWIGGNLFMRARVGGVNTNLTTPIVDIANWHHFALTYDGTTLRGYRDAVQFSSSALTGTIDSADQINLSDTPDTSVLDDLRFFDQALGQEQIEELMNTPVAGEITGGSTLSVAFDVDADGVVGTGSAASLNVAFGVVADGTVATGSGAVLTGTFSTTAAGSVDGGGDASLSAQVAILATGTIEAAPEANLAITASLSAVGVVSGNPGFCEPLTVTLTGPELTVTLTGPELTVEVTAC